MSRKLSMDRKNVYRREESQRVRTERVLTGYVKHRHPKIYDEAMGFYEHLNQIYPNKKDLRRSNEYEWLRNGTDKTMRKYYTRKRKITDNMVLNIPLMDESEIGTENTTQTDEIPTCQHEITAETTLESSSQYEVAQAENTTQTDEIPTCQHEITVETTLESSSQYEVTQETEVETSTTIPSADLLPPVSDEILEQIINGLREDPDINNFFEDIDFELDDCPLW